MMQCFLIHKQSSYIVTFITNMHFKSNIFKIPTMTKHTFFWHTCFSSVNFFWNVIFFILYHFYSSYKHSSKQICGKNLPSSSKTDLTIIVIVGNFNDGLFNGKLSFQSNSILIKSLTYSKFLTPFIVLISSLILFQSSVCFLILLCFYL